MRSRLIILIVLLSGTLSSCRNDSPCEIEKYQQLGDIYPDYMDVTVPPTVAPLNFSYVRNVPADVRTVFSCGDYSIVAYGRKVSVSPKKWKKLLSMAIGGDIQVYSQALDSTWTIHVSADAIDYGLNYRLIEPSYEKYSGMGIYERELSSFNQSTLIRNTEFEGCCNCHSHCIGDPGTMSIHIRGSLGCTLLLKDGVMKAYNTKTDSTLANCVYTYWHPSGDYIAYSSNISVQNFNVTADKVLEVIDRAGDVMVYDVHTNQLILSPLLTKGDFVESFPSFSPDGKVLYFTRFNIPMVKRNQTGVRYELCRIDFNPETGLIGDDLQVLIDSTDICNGSVCHPKPSPDGRYILFSRADYGIFASWHHESDLWLYDLERSQLRSLDEVNCGDSESCPAWSSNGRWFVYGSRRDDGLFTRLYIAHFDPLTGRCGKPFMLPQKDPERYYNGLFFSYNIPEFVKGPKEFDHIDARKLIYKKDSTGKGMDRIQFGLRRQGRFNEFDAITGSTVSALRP